MAALSPFLLKPRPDGFIGISIKIDHKNERRYIQTENFCTKKDLTAEGKLKKSFYSAPLETILRTYRDRIAQLGTRIREYTAEDIKRYLIRQDATDGGKQIDFTAFCDKRNEEIKVSRGKNGTYYCNRAAVGWLRKYKKSEVVDIKDITKRELDKLEEYMTKQGLGAAGVNCYMRAIRTLFLAAMDEYNDDAHEEFPIKHYPFRKYKIAEVHPDKRSIEIFLFIKIITTQALTKREEIGQDILFLSFLLAGIAPVDLYSLSPPKRGYIEYYRDKVKHLPKRILVRIPVSEQADIIIKKYSTNGFLSDIKTIYSSARNLSRACGEGLYSLCSRIETKPVTLYWARHTFASIAGDLGYDTNLIDFVLGHSPKDYKMAEVYITRKQEAVNDLVREVTNATVVMWKLSKCHSILLSILQSLSNFSHPASLRNFDTVP